MAGKAQSISKFGLSGSVLPTTSDLAPMGPLSWVNTPRDLQHLVALFDDAEEVVIDLETTGLDEWAVSGGASNGGVAARVVLAALTIPERGRAYEPGVPGREPTTYVLPLSHPDSPWLTSWRTVLRKVAEALVESRVRLTNQNVKFDCRWIYATTGVDLSGLISWDTQISSHLLDENESTRLKDRAPATFGVQRWDDFDLSFPGAAETVPLFDLGLYAARDTWYTWRLAERHRAIMFLSEESEQPLDAEEVMDARLGLVAQYVSMPTTASLTRMEQRGILLDIEWVRARLAEEEAKAEETLAAMAALYDVEGTPSSAATATWFKAWTSAAVEAGDLVVASLTPTGVPAWTAAVLERQARQGSETAALVLRQREASKVVGYLRSWLEKVTPAGTIHASYRAGSVATGRLSSADPNMQQITKSLRPAFIPRPGYVIADLDYSQIELRVAAAISGCVPMIEAFQRGDDLHRLLAQRILQTNENHIAAEQRRAPRTISLDEVTPEARQKGKSANFGLLYEMSAYGFKEYAETAYGVEMSEEEAAEVYAAFFDMWTGMREWHERAKAEARRRGFVRSPLGRIRRLPDIFTSYEKAVKHAERAAINSPVQGFASDLMQIATASIQGLLDGHDAVDGAYPVATVHDSVVLEIEEGRWKEIVQECLWRMERAVLGVLREFDVTLPVPLVADATVGTRWGLGDVDN